MPIVTRKSYNKSIIAIPRVGHDGEIFRYRSRTDYLPVLPSQSCNNIYIVFDFFVVSIESKDDSGR